MLISNGSQDHKARDYSQDKNVLHKATGVLLSITIHSKDASFQYETILIKRPPFQRNLSPSKSICSQKHSLKSEPLLNPRHTHKLFPQNLIHALNDSRNALYEICSRRD